MTDAANVLSILDYITSAGEPVSGGSIEFYQAGTSTARTVYSDAALTVSLGTIVYTDSEGFPVSTQGGSTRVSIYTGTAAYKVIVKNSAGTTLFTRDNIPGALDTSGFTTTSALPTVPVSAKAAAYTITTSDRGYLFNANPTGGTFVLTLPSAVTAGNNFAVGVRHNGTANQVTLATVSSQYIRGPGTPTSYFSLVGRGEEVWLTSDGADWIVTSYTPALIRPGLLPPPIHITDRLTAAPSSPTAGARYIVGSSPTGAWSTLSFSQHDIAEADGNGSWIKYTPTDGWLAYVADENLLTQYRDTAWTDLSNITAPSSAALEVAEFYYDGTGTNTLTQSAWTTVPLNTAPKNSITSASFASNKVTLPAGDYLVFGMASFLIPQSSGASTGRCRLYDVTNSAEKITSVNHTTNNVASQNVGLVPTLFGYLSVSAATEYRLEAWTSTSGVSLGSADTSSSGEKYANLVIIDLASMQGPQGTQGAKGSDGLDAAYPYQWSTSTSGDPGSGKVAGNNATIASITQLAISETDSAGGSMAAVIATWDDSTSSVRATVKISKEGATQNFHAFQITGAGTDQGSYRTFPVTYVATSGTISNGDNCALLVVEKGDKGDTGATGTTGSTTFTFSTTTTDSDPGSGVLRLNHATPASATAAYIDNNNKGASDVSSWLDTFDDTGESSFRGHLQLMDSSAPTTAFRIYQVTGSVVDGTGYRKVTIASVSGAGSFTNGNDMVVAWYPRGATGAGDTSGPASSTDNAVARFDGAGGKTLQNSVVTVSDTGVVVGASVVASGSTTARTLAARFADTLNVKDFGALGDGSTNDTAAIVAAVAAVPAAGGCVYFPAGVYMVTPDQLVLGNGDNSGISTRNGIALIGDACTPYLTTSGTVIKARSAGTSLLTLAGSVHGLRIENILFDCDGVCANGWTAYSINNCNFRNFGIVDFTAYGIQGGCRSYGPGAVGWSSTNIFEQFFITSSVVADFGAGILLDGYFAQSYDWFRNDFRVGIIQVNKGTANATAAIWLKFCDSNTFYDVDADAVTGSVGYSVIFDGSANALYPQNNYFLQCSHEQGQLVSGTISKNYFIGYPTRDSEPIPSNSNLIGFTDQGQFFGLHTFSSTVTPTTNDAAALGTSALKWSDLFLATGGVVNWNNGGITITEASDSLAFAGASGGYKFDVAVVPATSDVAPLGTAALQWSDLFLAEGGVINWDNGDVSITQTGNALAFAGASSGYSFDALLDVTAGQIKFPSSQNASADANTLDDYEEGSFTPAITFDTAGDLAVAYSAQTGTYTKVGRQVNIEFYVVTSTFTHTTASGSLRMTGLPFTVNAASVALGSLIFERITKAGYTQFVPAPEPSTTYVRFRASGSGVGFAFVNAADMPTAGVVLLHGSASFAV